MTEAQHPEASGPDEGHEPEPPAPETLDYERARDELVRIVSQLEAGNITLEQSLALWERGEALAVRCEQHLEQARQRLDSDPSGAAQTHTEAVDQPVSGASESSPTNSSNSS